MAFGRNTTATTSQTANAENEKRGFFPTNMIRFGLGESRKIRLLVDPTDPQYPEPGVGVYYLWADVNAGGKRVKRKLFMDKATKLSLPEGLLIFYRVYMNVYDLTPVILVQTDPEDPRNVELAQRDKDGKFHTGFLTKSKDGRKFYETPAPTANKRVMILEAKQELVKQLEGLPLVVIRPTEDGESEPVGLLDMEITISERLDNATKKPTIVAGGQAIPTADRGYWNLPRYDMNAFKPWPAEAVTRILGGDDFDEILKEYQINNVPRLVEQNEEKPF